MRLYVTGVIRTRSKAPIGILLTHYRDGLARTSLVGYAHSSQAADSRCDRMNRNSSAGSHYCWRPITDGKIALVNGEPA